MYIYLYMKILFDIVKEFFDMLNPNFCEEYIYEDNEFWDFRD